MVRICSYELTRNAEITVINKIELRRRIGPGKGQQVVKKSSNQIIGFINHRGNRNMVIGSIVALVAVTAIVMFYFYRRWRHSAALRYTAITL